MSGDLRVVRAIRVTKDEARPEPARPAPPTSAVAPPVPPPAPAAPPAPAPTLERDVTERVPVAPAPASDQGAVDPAVESVADPAPASLAGHDDERIAILRALERGEIDVKEAGERLEAIDDR
jgi:hypothetical protein